MRNWSINRMFALLMGILFLVLAVFGWIFAPTRGMLFAIFHTGTFRNVVTSITAILAFLAAYSGERASRMFNQVFGIFYLALGILGFIPGFNRGGVLFDFIHVNNADNILDIVLGAIAAYLGFGAKGVTTASTRTAEIPGAPGAPGASGHTQGHTPRWSDRDREHHGPGEYVP
jgi:uncharacterized protein DUF4383